MTGRAEESTGSRSDAQRDARAAARVGAGIFLSRLTGFARERVTGYWFGAGDYADAWRAALRLPNVLQNLLGEGTLSASFIPVYAEFLEQGRDEEAGRFAGAALGILLAVAGALALIGAAAAPLLVALFFSEWDEGKQAVTTTLVRILFPMSGIAVLGAWALGILNSHRRFFVSYVAPVFWNLAMIITLVAGGAWFGLGLEDLVVALGWGALVGGGLQLGVQLPFVLRHAGGIRISLGRRVEGVRDAVRSFGPVVAARGVVNLSGWIDVILAARLVDGAVALLGYAQTFYVLPISLFGMSVAASELPELSRRRGEAMHALADRVSAALRRAAFFLIPSAIGYLALGDVIVAALYETGAFGSAETLITWGVLGGYTLGLTASGSSRVLSSAFYALRDTRTPARIAVLRVVTSASVGIALMFPLDSVGFRSLRLGAAGLSLGASAGAWLEYLLLRRALARSIGSHGPGVGTTLRMTLAATLAAGAGVGLQLLLPATDPIVLALETLLPFGVVYLAASAALGVPIPSSRILRR